MGCGEGYLAIAGSPPFGPFISEFTILGAAFIAAIWPAESAVHGSLVEALEYE